MSSHTAWAKKKIGRDKLAQFPESNQLWPVKDHLWKSEKAGLLMEDIASPSTSHSPLYRRSASALTL